jgi:hypothetical protein
MQIKFSVENDVIIDVTTIFSRNNQQDATL